MKFLIQSMLSCAAVFVFTINGVYGQADTIKLEDLSLKELLNVKIVSASKASELLFDAPLSASVVTSEEIRRTGCTSIMEAMRLVPGMIVREESNGNYDIHLRGMDNVPPNAPFDITSNTTTLVMIDNRPVYSYLRGGTFWETLSIDINDIEKIEVVRGAAAALYGPNAVNGVINIITRHVKKDGLYAIANSQQGSNRSFIENASIGYRFNEKLSIIASGNYQYRERSQTSYFEFNRNTWLEHPDYFLSFDNAKISNVDTRYPYPDLAMRKYAGDVFAEYTPTETIKLNISTGAQNSLVQKVSTENEVTPLSTASSESKYFDFRANIKDLSAQLSYKTGTQITDHDPGNKFDFHIVDANLEYTYIIGKLSVKSGFSYKSAIYDDTKYSDIKSKAGIFNARGNIITHSALLRGDYHFFNKRMRLVAGLSTNTFNYPNATYIAYQFAATYKVSNHHLFRLDYSQSPRSSNIFDTYVDQNIVFFPSGAGNYTEIALVGNKNLKLLTADMLEFGYRSSIGKHFSIDVELFNIHTKNFSTSVTSSPILEYEGTDTIHETPIRIANLPLTLRQQGFTLSLSYVSEKLQVKSFFTLQHTRMRDYAPFINTPDADIPGAAQNNIYSGIGTAATLKSTPASFGGGFVNYMISSKINMNVTAYYYTKQTYNHLSNILFNDGIRGIDHIPAKLILNAKISYEPAKDLELFLSGKNILNEQSREFFKTDDVPFMLLGGINYELK